MNSDFAKAIKEGGHRTNHSLRDILPAATASIGADLRPQRRIFSGQLVALPFVGTEGVALARILRRTDSLLTACITRRAEPPHGLPAFGLKRRLPRQRISVPPDCLYANGILPETCRQPRFPWRLASYAHVLTSEGLTEIHTRFCTAQLGLLQNFSAAK